MRLVGATDNMVNEDKYHLGYEVLFSTHSSPMVPKESPIKVLYLCKLPKDVTAPTELLLAISGPKPGLDERHGDNQEDVLFVQERLAFSRSKVVAPPGGAEASERPEVNLTM